MSPTEIVDRLISLMLAYVERRRGRSMPSEASPLDVLFGKVQVIDPMTDDDLRKVGVGTTTTWIESLSKAQFAGVVGPLPGGSFGFAPSQRFADLVSTASPMALRHQVLQAVFPVTPTTPSRASLEVAKLREEIIEARLAVDKNLLEVVLRELQDVCLHDCRHAAIALSGKLIELGLGSILASWNVQVPNNAGLSELINRIRSRANEQQTNNQQRTQAHAIIHDLGLDGLSDFIRNARNGAVHARVFREDGQRVELPSNAQMEAVVLLTIDLLRRFILINEPGR